MKGKRPLAEFPKIGVRVQQRIAITGLVQEIARKVKENIARNNPYAQLPSTELGKKHGVTRETVIKIARAIRQRSGFGEKGPKGGPRVKFALEVQKIILEFFRNAQKQNQPVNGKKLIIEIARKTRTVVTVYGINGYCKKAGVRVSYIGIPKITGHKGLDSSLIVLEQAGLKPGIDFDMPKRRRKPAR